MSCWVTSPAQRASCGSGLWGALQLVSASTAWFLAEWTGSCWQTRRQVVCTFLDKALRKSEVDKKKHFTGRHSLFELQISAIDSWNPTDMSITMKLVEPIVCYSFMTCRAGMINRKWFDNKFIGSSPLLRKNMSAIHLLLRCRKRIIFLRVKWISLEFGLLVKQHKEFEDVFELSLIIL